METIAAKDETIAALRETNAALLAFINRLTDAKAAPVETAKTPRLRKPSKAVDLADVDPTDNEALAHLALREMGTSASMSHLQRKVEHIRRQVVQAHADRKQERGQTAMLAEATAPAEVIDKIEAAIRQGQEDART